MARILVATYNVHAPGGSSLALGFLKGPTAEISPGAPTDSGLRRPIAGGQDGSGIKKGGSRLGRASFLALPGLTSSGGTCHVPLLLEHHGVSHDGSCHAVKAITI